MGAPKGNKNHLIHGLYSRNISISEADTIKKSSPDLNHEIVLLRVFVLRIACQLESRLEYDEQDRELLNTLNRMCNTIGILSTRRAYLNGSISEATVIIDSLVEKNSGLWLKS